MVEMTVQSFFVLPPLSVNKIASVVENDLYIPRLEHGQHFICCVLAFYYFTFHTANEVFFMYIFNLGITRPMQFVLPICPEEINP